MDTFMYNNPSEKGNNMNAEETRDRIIEIINSLIQINNDRIEGYQRAADETDQPDLQLLFNRMMTKSEMLKSQLSAELRKYGGTPTDSTTTLGKVFRVWMDFKAAVTAKDRKAILASCEFGEDAAQDTYNEAINENNSFLPVDLLQLITDQRGQLRVDHNQVTLLRNKE